jgi:hypothetical protein
VTIHVSFIVTFGRPEASCAQLSTKAFTGTQLTCLMMGEI